MTLKIDLAVLRAGEERLVDDRYRLAQLDEVVLQLDVLGVQPDTAVADTRADTVGLVRAVNQVARNIELQHVPSQRIVRAGGDNCRQWIAKFLVLFAHRRRHVPARIARLGNDG